MGYNLEDRINILHLSKGRVNELRKLELKDLPLDPSDDVNCTLKTINVDYIVGVYRPIHARTWLEMLDSKYCYKEKNFKQLEAAGLEIFKKFLLNPNFNDLPIVYQYKNEYYIAGEGLHRLTIAKCIGHIKTKVAVKEITF